VRTSFVLQVDADMILDAGCVEALRAAMAPAVGVVVGWLRDPLLGRIVGVKLFRTACLRETRFPGSVSPDSDAVSALRARGWAAVHALRRESQHTFGRHEPEYTRPYTYAKFLITGARHRYRRNGGATRGLFRRLCASAHPLAPLATAALAHGLFVDAPGDLLDARRHWPLPPHLERGGAEAVDVAPPRFERRTLPTSLEQSFAQGYRAGMTRSGVGAAAAVRAEYARLGADWTLASWVSAVGFFHGLLRGEEGTHDAEQEFARLACLLHGADGVAR
jgi:hypothetical protein